MEVGINKGILYLIPLPVAEDALQTLPLEVATHTAIIKHYFVENARTARRFLRALHPKLILEVIEFSEIDKHSGIDAQLLREWLRAGKPVGVMSEAGCPAVADPGSKVVAIAHGMNVKVVPLTGPNSIILALMASGLNGQNFAFWGYLPVKDPARSKRIKELEALSVQLKQTQIFIETPYRNDHLFMDLMKACHPATKLCIACNITSPEESIVTQTIADWRQAMPTLGKQPVVFLLMGQVSQR